MTIFNPGDNIYKFTLKQKLGGTFGEVWLAYDNTLNKDVALKILEASFEPVARLLEEARIGNKFNHKNLLPIHYADVCSNGAATYTLISQEYLPNGTVINALNSGNFLELPQVLCVLQDVLFGLEYLHNSGFYHNDIKPGNILLDNQKRAVLADYGIAGFSATKSPIAPSKFYKIHSAPETYGSAGVISIQSDIYQVGCTAYRLLNGISCLKNDFVSDGDAIFSDKKKRGKIPDPKGYQPHVPTTLRNIINKALNIDPAKRFKSALEMRRKLEKLSFPAYWTTDFQSQLIGIGKTYTYQFEVIPRAANRFNLISTKQKKLGGKRNRVLAFCANNLSHAEMEILRDEFIAWVVENGK